MNIDSFKDSKSTGLKDSDMDSLTRPTFSNVAAEDVTIFF